MSQASALDPEKLKGFAKQVFGSMSGAMTAAMIHLGDRLGLYRVLAAGGPATSAELAQRTGLHERWLREWLYQQGAAGILDVESGERFGLTPEGRAVLAEENHPAFGAGFFTQLPAMLGVLGRIGEAFQTGIGLPYDAFGPEGAAGVERGFAPWFKNFLVPVAMGALPEVAQRLTDGAKVADVGCGSGVALIELARAFPLSQFHGFDISLHALSRARDAAARAGLANVAFHDAKSSPLPASGDFALVTTFDCLHDMTDPAGALRGVRAALAKDGTWLAADIKAHASYADNVAQNPMAAMMYGTSVLACMSSALSEAGGAGLGTLGLPCARLEAMARAAGFSQFRELDLGHPVNAFYVGKP
jgi:SAM-dependent methyltransferase